MTDPRKTEPQIVHGRTRAVDSVRSRGLVLSALLLALVGAVLYRAAADPGVQTPSEEASPLPSASEFASAEPSSTEPSATLPRGSAAAPTPILGHAGERTGVPVSLRDRMWLRTVLASQYWPSGGDGPALVAGVLGSTAVIVMPPGERPVGADEGRVVSVVRGDNVSMILVRSFDDGSVLRSIETPMVVLDGVVIGTTLLWSGVRLEGTTLTDRGSWAVDLLMTDAEAVQVIEPVTDVQRFGELGLLDYGPWVVSATGDTAVAWLAGETAIQGYVIDLSSLSVRGTFADAVPLAVTDDAVLLEASGKLTLHDAATGAQRWTIDSPQYNQEPMARFAHRDGEFILGFARDDDTYVIAALDVVTGAIRDLAIQTWVDGVDIQYLVPALSSPDALVLLSNASIAIALDTTGEASASLLDPGTGEIARDVFMVGAPR